METNDILFFDIETEANPEALDFIQDPKAPANYKDADKIAAYVAEKKAEQTATAALDADYGRIIAIAYQYPENRNERAMVGQTTYADMSEEDMIRNFWEVYYRSSGVSCGYNIIGFDLPYILRRSFALGVKVPLMPKLNKYYTYPTIDLMGILYNWGPAKGLKWVCKRYGIDNPLPDLDGSKVARMHPDELRDYAANDVQMTVELYRKMQGIYF